jgi:hypothetical protein
MPYEWEFTTGGRPEDLRGKKCHRGPMIDVEVRMSQPFVIMGFLERERVKLLEALVDTTLWPVRTRDDVLRVLNGDMGSIFTRLLPQKKYLQVLICEKRRAIDIDADVRWLDSSFKAGVERLLQYGIQEQHIVLMRSALQSESPIQRVAGRCAVILIAAYIELDAGT